MPNILYSQNVFSSGELSPLMYARTSVQQYYQGLKTAKNVLNYPQGAAGKRFGTIFEQILGDVTNYKDIFFQTFTYLNECVYLLAFVPDKIKIYLEGQLVSQITGTGLDGTDVHNLDYTTLEAKFRVTGHGFKPKDLVRTPNAANVIVSAASNEFTLTNPITAGFILPARFTTSGNLPTTVPQIKAGVTYFVNHTSTTTIKVFATAEDAHFLRNEFTITNAGTGTNNYIPQNTWTFADTVFKNLPVYDFNGGYDAITFTPSAVSGAAVTLTASSAIFTAAHVGGAYVGGGGVGRITAVGSSTSATIAVSRSFDSPAAPISGRLSFLAEPAWSTARGWPLKCSSFQNRAIFANTESLPNGIWCSAINDYSDFDDLETDDDDAISYFPTSDDINYIRYIVPYRSLTVYTNSGVFSTPLIFETAITPRNFTLQEQDTVAVDVIKPRAVDNQIIIISGNDAHSLLWDGASNSYSSSIVSVLNEQLIRSPVDEAAFTNLRRAGSRYIFIVNEDGSMAIYQTLLAESVSGWTSMVMEQHYGTAKIRQVAASLDGRAWFLVERETAVAATPVAITGFDDFSLLATASNFSTEPKALVFTTTGTLPESEPQIVVGRYYWGIGVDANNFKVYLTKEDAENDEDAIEFGDAGTNSNVVPWPLETKFYIERLSFDVFVDCATEYDSDTPTSTLTGASRFNAQDIKMQGDGFGFEDQVIGDEIDFIAHGEAAEVNEAFAGFPINFKIEPLPISISTGQNINSTNIVKPKHIRNATFMFNNTIGGTINGVPIALNKFDLASIGEPPVPSRGIFEISVMKGWDDFNESTFTIEHDEPFDIQLLGIFYTVDVGVP